MEKEFQAKNDTFFSCHELDQQFMFSLNCLSSISQISSKHMTKHLKASTLGSQTRSWVLPSSTPYSHVHLKNQAIVVYSRKI